jgi:hypothetical protein
MVVVLELVKVQVGGAGLGDGVQVRFAIWCHGGQQGETLDSAQLGAELVGFNIT